MEDNKNVFLESIKFEEDKDKIKLLQIQKKIENIGITRENVISATKDLTDIQKSKLLNLYNEQIKSLNSRISNYKKRIISIKNIQCN